MANALSGLEEALMTKNTSLLNVRPRKHAASFGSRASAVLAQSATWPVKPLLIGMGIGAALFGTAMAARGRRGPLHLPFSAPSPEVTSALTRSALVALARVVGGQNVRSVATSVLLEVADALKK